MFLRKVGMTLTGRLPAVILVLIFIQGIVCEPEEIGRPGLQIGGMGTMAAQPLREVLARKLLSLIVDADPLPSAVCFYTDGVKLVCEGSPVLAELQGLEGLGVHLVICKTCLDYFGLADQARCGVVGGMTDIITAMWTADTVIEL